MQYCDDVLSHVKKDLSEVGNNHMNSLSFSGVTGLKNVYLSVNGSFD